MAVRRPCQLPSKTSAGAARANPLTTKTFDHRRHQIGILTKEYSTMNIFNISLRDKLA